ncbi:hypothetical protein E2C01_017162 [Portunus trituberculatus]|uniref:Uncharacterized protein n=1 Tax=Portunus trituberculatus TaxID=210409 RepID=A0A5B7DR61_PORTR|nr:hypothetical protein [Portunus trituberculatus]
MKIRHGTEGANRMHTRKGIEYCTSPPEQKTNDPISPDGRPCHSATLHKTGRRSVVLSSVAVTHSPAIMNSHRAGR